MRNHYRPWFADGLRRTSLDYEREVAQMTPEAQTARELLDRQWAAIVAHRMKWLELFNAALTDCASDTDTQ